MAATALLCDGSAFARDLLGDALEGAGWTVVARVGTGAAALAALRTHRPAVIITDLLLPDQEGFALLAALRAEAPASVLVVCTGLGDAVYSRKQVFLFFAVVVEQSVIEEIQ